MNKTFSANMLKTFEESPEKYKMIYEEKISFPQDSSYAQEGQNIHALINYYLKGFNVKNLVSSLTDNEKVLWQNFLKLNIKPTDIYETEYVFNHKTDNKNWLTGRIDAIVRQNDDYIIYDWKTGCIPKNSEQNPQTILYLYCIFNKLQKDRLVKNEEQLSLVYINLKKTEKTTIHLNTTLYKEYKNYIKNLINQITLFAKQ